MTPKARVLVKLAAACVLTATIASACGSDKTDDDDGTTSGNTSGALAGPSTGSSSCASACPNGINDCAANGCVCNDMSISSATVCTNGCCLDAAGACPDACAAYGGWSGMTAG